MKDYSRVNPKSVNFKEVIFQLPQIRVLRAEKTLVREAEVNDPLPLYLELPTK